MRRIVLALLLCACTPAPGAEGDGAAMAGLTADPPGDGTSVFLRGRGEGSQLRVDVFARGAPDLHGAALRVTFEPEALAFAGAEASGVWSRRSMALAKEGAPGQLAIAWFEKGERAIAAEDETRLGTLTFDVKSRRSSAIAFRAERSALMDRDGKALLVAWKGGRVEGR